MDGYGPYRIRTTLPGGAEYQALEKLQMGLTVHADKKGYDLVVPRAKYFIADAPQLPGISDQMLDIRAQNNGENVARLYSTETIDTVAFAETGTFIPTWGVSIESSPAPTPSPPAARSSHLRLVPKTPGGT